MYFIESLLFLVGNIKGPSSDKKCLIYFTTYLLGTIMQNLQSV